MFGSKEQFQGIESASEDEEEQKLEMTQVYDKQKQLNPMRFPEEGVEAYCTPANQLRPWDWQQFHIALQETIRSLNDLTK